MGTSKWKRHHVCLGEDPGWPHRQHGILYGTDGKGRRHRDSGKMCIRDRHSVGIATDLGKYNDYIVKNLENLDAVLLEANHDIRMLQVGKYPYYLKQRILGDRGHLSNENAGRLLCRILHDNLKAVFLGHLSRENNYEELAYETVDVYKRQSCS